MKRLRVFVLSVALVGGVGITSARVLLETGGTAARSQSAVSAGDAYLALSFAVRDANGSGIALQLADRDSGEIVDTFSLQGTLGPATNPDIEAAGDAWLLAWQELGHPDRQSSIRLARFADGLVGGPVTISMAGPAWDPELAIGQDSGLVIWFDSSDGHPAVRVRSIELDGTPRGDALRLSPEGVPAHYPVVAPHGGGFFAAWHQAVEGQQRVVTARLDVNGELIDGPYPVTGGGPISYYPALATGPEGIGLAYHAVGPDGWEIRFQRLHANGTENGAPIVLSQPGSSAMNATIAADQDGWAVAWMQRSGSEVSSWLSVVKRSDEGSVPEPRLIGDGLSFPIIATGDDQFWTLSVGTESERETLQLQPVRAQQGGE